MRFSLFKAIAIFRLWFVQVEAEKGQPSAKIMVPIYR